MWLQLHCEKNFWHIYCFITILSNILVGELCGWSHFGRSGTRLKSLSQDTEEKAAPELMEQFNQLCSGARGASAGLQAQLGWGLSGSDPF